MFDPVCAGTPAKLVWEEFFAHCPQNGGGGAAIAPAAIPAQRHAVILFLGIGLMDSSMSLNAMRRSFPKARGR
jgi:hypothetical protein